VLAPTLTVTFRDGRTERLLVDGEEIVANPGPRPVPWRHVLVAVDFSDASVGALRIGDALARLNAAQMTVCHVVHHVTPVSPLFPHYASVPDMEVSRREQEGDVERLDGLVADAIGRGADQYEAVILNGPPGEEIVRLARDRGVDLIVVASTGASGLERMLLGSVAEAVARNAHCQVLVAR
jgi:nucleotide-binding universal stress UspA family protein